MAGINQLSSNLDSLNLQYIVEDTLIDLAPELVKAQKDQLLHGRLSTGQKTGTYKIEAYALKKHEMNPLAGYGHKDYRLTGELFSGVFVDVRAKSIVFASADPKFGRVLDMNDGDDIMGLSDDTIAEKIAPKLTELSVIKIKEIVLK